MNRYEEVEELLKNYNMMKIHIENVEDEIEFVKNDITLNGIDYGGISVSPTNVIKSVVENKSLSIMDKVEGLEKEIKLNKMLINKLDRSLNTLEEIEREIVINKYIKSLQWWQVSCKVGFGERYCRTIRTNAIKKMVAGVFGHSRVYIA